MGSVTRTHAFGVKILRGTALILRQANHEDLTLSFLIPSFLILSLSKDEGRRARPVS